VGLIHWQGTGWAASISPLKVLCLIIISYPCLICLDDLLVFLLWEWEALCS
jgi:hypothetical protein